MELPKEYEWLLAEPGPKMLLEFLKIFGIAEVPGPGDNPLILEWAKEVGIRNYNHDAIAWCGLEMAVIAKRAGKQVPKGPLWAFNWATFGEKVTDGPKLGDVLVFRREGGGHVGMYVGEDDTCFHVAGGNQSDKSNIVRKPIGRIYSIRRPIYTVQPPNVRRIFLSDKGAIDNKES